MRRCYRPYAIAALSLMAAACSDSTAPVRSPSQSALLVAQPGTAGVASAKKSLSETKTVVFDLRPQGGQVYIGAFRLDYPANVVCDPAKSDYQLSAWKKSCATLNTPFTVTATYSVVDGAPRIEFLPNVRFDPSKEVRLSALVRDIRNKTLTDELRTKYAIVSLSDDLDNEPTVFGLKRNGTATGLISRRIFHFSGYAISIGRMCEEGSGDPECAEF